MLHTMSAACVYSVDGRSADSAPRVRTCDKWMLCDPGTKLPCILSHASKLLCRGLSNQLQQHLSRWRTVPQTPIASYQGLLNTEAVSHVNAFHSWGFLLGKGSSGLSVWLWGRRVEG